VVLLPVLFLLGLQPRLWVAACPRQRLPAEPLREAASRSAPLFLLPLLERESRRSLNWPSATGVCLGRPRAGSELAPSRPSPRFRGRCASGSLRSLFCRAAKFCSVCASAADSRRGWARTPPRSDPDRRECAQPSGPPRTHVEQSGTDSSSSSPSPPSHEIPGPWH